ncbi:hypothetical protein BJY52DRAFT_1277242 [Lactarius psammicola]|nr:hypothetical protein BJY52DRAFT_1277242 [Lactarius psammicola]
MPHKRAKRSAREQQRKESTALSTESIPKSISRVLDAARIRAEYRQKKRARRLEEDARDGGDVVGADAPTLAKAKKRRRSAADSGVDKSTIEIQPGESLKHFNRRVEDHMRPLVQSAMRASAATERKEKRAAATATAVNETLRESKACSSIDKSEAEGTTATGSDKHRDRPKEFATISSARPRHLNDIATAPPELKRLPRGASNLGAKYSAPSRTKAAGGVLSMAQRAMMETERENAIRRYREMKERKVKEESEQTPS